MSLINRMLQDLDQRNAIAGKDGKLPLQQVRPVPPERVPHTMLWRLVAGLVIVTLGWAAWTTYEAKRPRAVLTERAFMADEQARRAPARPAAPVMYPPAPSMPPEQVQKEPTPPAQETKPPEMESFKLALSIDTPIPERPRRGPSAAAKSPQAAPGARVVLAPPAKSPEPPRVQKRDRAYTPAERAETSFNRAVALLNQGRVAEAESQLTSALASEPRYEAARQTLVALLLEQQRVDEATPLLREGLALDPQQTQFAMVLGRIQMERRDYVSAVETLSSVKAAGESYAEFDYLMAAALQRLSRHQEAAAYYQAAVSLAPQSALSWLGLAISLESLQRRQEAAEAYRRALASDTLSADVRAYAEQRVKQLR